MNIGMLWFDNDPKKGLNEKVCQAAEYFKKKYGAVADFCLVSPAMLAEGQHQQVSHSAFTRDMQGIGSFSQPGFVSTI